VLVVQRVFRAKRTNLHEKYDYPKFDLKDGSTVYVFKDGKMAMEDRLGRTVGMKAGHVMETKDGQKIIMVGNELARLEMIKAEKRGGN